LGFVLGNQGQRSLPVAVAVDDLPAKQFHRITSIATVDQVRARFAHYRSRLDWRQQTALLDAGRQLASMMMLAT